MNKKEIKIAVSIVLAAVFFMFIFKVILMRDNESKNQKKILIGMSQCDLYDPWKSAMNSEIKDEAEKHNEIQMIYKDAAGDIEKQKQDINDLIGFGVDLLIVSVDDSKEIMETVKEANYKVPVIVLGRSVYGDDYSLYIGMDLREIGKEAGQMAVDIAGNEKVNIVEIQGMLNSKTDDEISSEFKKVIDKHRNINVVRTVIGEWNKSETKDKIKNIIHDENDINLIFAHSDYMGLGAYEALKDSNITNIKIIGIDGLNGENNGVYLVKNEIFTGTFLCKTGGKEAIIYGLKILNHEDNIPKKILFDTEKITA